MLTHNFVAVARSLYLYFFDRVETASKLLSNSVVGAPEKYHIELIKYNLSDLNQSL